MDGGLGLPISRNGVNSQSQPRFSNWMSSSNGQPKLQSGPTVIEEPFKKVKKPTPQSQAQSRCTTPTPSNNGVTRTEGDKKQGGEGRGMAASTSFKSLSDSSSADTTDSKVVHKKSDSKARPHWESNFNDFIFARSGLVPKVNRWERPPPLLEKAPAAWRLQRGAWSALRAQRSKRRQK